MTPNHERFVAAFAAVLIMATSFTAAVSVPAQRPVLASAAAPALA